MKPFCPSMTFEYMLQHCTQVILYFICKLQTTDYTNQTKKIKTAQHNGVTDRTFTLCKPLTCDIGWDVWHWDITMSDFDMLCYFFSL